MTTEHISPAELKRRVGTARGAPPEGETQDSILTWLAWMKVRAVRVETAGQPVYGPGGIVAGLRVCMHVGTPDVLVWLPWGQACAIEVKRPGQGPSGLRFTQARWITETAKLSPWTIILIAETLLDVEEVLKPLVDTWNVNENHPREFWFRADHAAWRAATSDAVRIATKRIAGKLR